MAIGKNLGANSQSSNDFLKPHAPENVSATNVGVSRPFDNGQISITFTIPADSPAASHYTIQNFVGGGYVDYAAQVQGLDLPESNNGIYTVSVDLLASGSVHTVALFLSNDSGNSPTTNANEVTVTTVPATMSAPTVTSPAPSASANAAGATYDTVSWTAPANGGSSITLYRWTSSDGKTGTTTSTSVDVTQEGGTAQTYQVRAENANGSGAYSNDSGSVTTFSFTPFSFVPFGAFGFSPFNAFGFSPFNAFSFSPFNAFSFSPFNAFSFTPFNFAPFGFTPFNFAPR
jgi:hypothetical protein